MPSVPGTEAAYERALSYFDLITITQGNTVATAQGRIFAETGDPLSDAIQQGRLRAIIRAKGLPFVPARGDLLDAGESHYVISAVDDATRRVFGTVVAYEVTL